MAAEYITLTTPTKAHQFSMFMNIKETFELMETDQDSHTRVSVCCVSVIRSEEGKRLCVCMCGCVCVYVWLCVCVCVAVCVCVGGVHIQTSFGVCVYIIIF